tara:strand:- start:594 stop:1235 length:642 start_codon:yes stop_codon:yes gene_type:complete
MTIKLVGSTAGSVSLDAPASTNSSADLTLTLPTSTGSANQYLKNSGTAGELEFAAGPSAGLFTAYAQAWVQTDTDVGGGAATAGSWGTVPFLDSSHKVESGLTVTVDATANTVQVPTGTYLIKWAVPFYDTGESKTRLYSVTGGSILKYGTAIFSNTSHPSTIVSNGFHKATFNANTTLRLEYDVATTNSGGLGRATDDGLNIFTTIEFYKEG